MKRRSQAIPDLRGVYQNKRHDKVTVTYAMGDVWTVRDKFGQKREEDYEGMVEFLEEHGYQRVVVLETQKG